MVEGGSAFLPLFTADILLPGDLPDILDAYGPFFLFQARDPASIGREAEDIIPFKIPCHLVTLSRPCGEN